MGNYNPFSREVQPYRSDARPYDERKLTCLMRLAIIFQYNIHSTILSYPQPDNDIYNHIDNILPYKSSYSNPAFSSSFQ
jgi:hypothetical protein